MNFTGVEIELSSKCNALCPGCKRTHLNRRGESFEAVNLDEDLIYERFSCLPLDGFREKLCGVLGDPLLHPKMLDVTRWFLERGSHVQISTNAGLRNEAYWRELASLGVKYQRLYNHFAVDGLEDTNHIYRIGTNFDRIDKNMTAYAMAGGKGAWIFIEFSHNSHQIEEAKKRADRLGLDFKVRRAAKNDVHDWFKSNTGDGDKSKPKASTQPTQHRSTATYKRILNNEISKFEAASVDCKMVHGHEFFGSATATVWPCCYLWDEYLGKKQPFYDQIQALNPEWNSLKSSSFSEVFENPFFTQINQRWDQDRQEFTKRCYLSCGDKGLLRNSFQELQ